MSAVAELKPQGALTAMQTSGRMAVADIISHVATVQEVMKAVMKKDVHYGVIPGTDKPTLLKPGAEVLCMAFRIADKYEIEDLSEGSTVRYRVTCVGSHQTMGTVLGSGMGEASSGEEKYKWRKAWDDEFDATPENLRRIKKGKYTTKQVRTEPADLANTILKMANKRAKMAMVLNVTAASDCFTQDLEDMDEAMRDHLARQESGAAAASTHGTTPPPYPDDDFKKNLPIWQKAVKKGKTPDEVINTVNSLGLILNEAQVAVIKAIPAELLKAAGDRKPDGRTGPGEAPAVTYAQCAEALNKATDMDKLNDAATLINAIENADQQRELNAMYDQRAEALNK